MSIKPAEEHTPEKRRPTGWIVLCGVLALAVVDEAEQARADASGAVDAAKAEAEAFKAQLELTQTCLRGTLDAVGAAVEGGGLEAAAAELEKLSGSCAT